MLPIMRNRFTSAILWLSILLDKKILYIVLDEFTCVTRMKYANWIENELMHYRFRTTWLRWDFLTEFDMENLKNKSTITRLTTHGNNAERRKMHKKKITQEFWTDFWEVRDIANHKKNLDGTKLSAQKWTNWHKNITLKSWRSPSVCDIHQIEVFNSTVQEVIHRWSLDLIIALQSHWKITCTDTRKFIKNESQHKIKTEYVKTPSSQKHTVKKLESTRKLGGNSGPLLLLFPAGDRVINGTGKSINQVSADLILIVLRRALTGHISHVIFFCHDTRVWPAQVCVVRIKKSFISIGQKCLNLRILHHSLTLILHFWHSLPLPWLLSQDQPHRPRCRSVNPVLRSHELWTVTLWPKHILSQVMSPTWRSHFWRFWGNYFVLPGLKCRDSQRSWRQRYGVSRFWDWRRAHQKYSCFVTVYTEERSWSRSETILSLQWRRFVSRSTVNFSKHEARRRLIDTKTQVLIRVSWRSDQDYFGLTKRKNCS